MVHIDEREGASLVPYTYEGTRKSMLELDSLCVSRVKWLLLPPNSERELNLCSEQITDRDQDLPQSGEDTPSTGDPVRPVVEGEGKGSPLKAGPKSPVKGRLPLMTGPSRLMKVMNPRQTSRQMMRCSSIRTGSSCSPVTKSHLVKARN